MSARDVDLEFEKAYQRLFSTSVAPPSGDRGSSTSSEPQVESFKAPHTDDNGARSRSTTAQLHSFDASILAQPRQSSVGQSRPHERLTQAQQLQRERQPQSRSFQSPLDALARHRTVSSSKGKARAPPSHVEAEERHVKSARRSPATLAAVLPHSSSMTYPSSVAYYPYPTGQPSYQVSAPLIAPGSNMTSMPGQAVAWTQPIMSTGPMPAIGYPGFSASVTFSQPQFFASPPQAVQQAAVAAGTPDGWVQQHIPQPSLRAVDNPAEEFYEQQQQQSTSESASGSRKHSVAQSAEQDDRLRKRNKENAEQFDNKAHLKRTSKSASKLDVARLKAKQKQVQKQPQEPWKPQLNKNDLHIPKKRGRPPRIRETTPLDVKPQILAPQPAIQIKSEETETQPLKPATTRRVFDGSLPLASDRGRPYNRETHTLFIHSPRRLLWIAHLAIARAENRVDAPGDVNDTSQWARWSNSVAARLQNLINEASPSRTAACPQPHSQSDPAGLFPRNKRHAYIALRKELHTAKRTPAARICMPKLLRYIARTYVAANRIDSRRARRAFLEDKHGAGELTRHMVRSAKAVALDARRLWCVWAREAHASREKGGKVGGRNVAFAPLVKADVQRSSSGSAAAGEASSEPRVKLEPESPSIVRTLPMVKQEPDSDGIMTPALAGSPSLGAVNASIESRPASERERRSPLFLRHNFRIYRMVGLKGLPLS